jgi:hypothetical protein
MKMAKFENLDTGLGRLSGSQVQRSYATDRIDETADEALEIDEVM